MYRPACQEALSYQDEYAVVPVCREIYADIVTPITLLRKIANYSSQYFLLESVEDGSRWGRYSFLGFDPVMTAEYRDGTVVLKGAMEQNIETQQPYEVLRGVMKQYRAPNIADMPPFTGGFTGYFSYESFALAEPSLSLHSGSAPLFFLMLFDRVIAYDHLKQKICVVANMKLSDGAAGYQKACGEIDRMIAKIDSMIPISPETAEEKPVFTSNIEKPEFCGMVQCAKRYITEGDIFQAVLSRRFDAEYHSSLLNVYRVLRTTNPSPYMFYMRMDGTELAGTSPETLIKLNDGMLFTYPVAGTRPRGATYEEDMALERELLADEKELAEHNMLVDLARNDIGKISKIGTVQVQEYLQVHRYSKVMHIASVVCGRIRQGLDAYDAIAALLPAGTLSGAPKIRACEIIRELEPDARGIYGGAVGYLDFSGNMDTCIAIRMAVRRNGIVSVQAGAGIVADSIPETECEEIKNKAGAVIHAVQAAGEVMP